MYQDRFAHSGGTLVAQILIMWLRADYGPSPSVVFGSLLGAGALLVGVQTENSFALGAAAGAIEEVTNIVEEITPAS